MTRIIKRYSNRRLYDTEDSRTLTQSDLADLVRQGIDVKVIDTASGEDITLPVLGRVLLVETSSWKDARETKELLSHIISLGGEKSMSILKNTVLASIGAFQVTKAKAEQIIDDLIKKGDLDESDRKKAVMELLDRAEKSTAKFADKVSKEAGKIRTEVTNAVNKLNLAKQSDLKALEKKIDKLSKSLSALEKKLNA
jgi:polyhydroxyalkanoate synthesis repressor PhaR